MKDIYVNRGVEKILGWPTDTFAIDWKYSDGATATRRRIHTIVLFVPGNPGLVEWYIPFFSEILKAIGPDYAIRGASYAGHSVDAQQIHVEEGKKTRPHDKSTNPTSPAGVPSTTLAWTIDGQVNHKISYLDKVLGLPEFRDARLIFIGHSIGCHLVKRMLLVRADFLSRTTQCIFLMPFIRMDAPTPHQQFLDWASKNPDTSDTILHTLSRVLSTLSPPMLESLLQSMMEKKEDREFTAKLIRQTRFPRNFLGLGLEEIRDVPQTIDVPGLKHISCRYGVPIAMLFAGNDHWGPEFHVRDLQRLVNRSILCRQTMALTHNPDLKHDFITTYNQTNWVTDFCIDLIQKGQHLVKSARSRL